MKFQLSMNNGIATQSDPGLNKNGDDEKYHISFCTKIKGNDDMHIIGAFYQYRSATNNDGRIDQTSLLLYRDKKLVK